MSLKKQDASQEQQLIQLESITNEQQQNTTTVQNLSDRSEVITINLSSLTFTTGSSLLHNPVRQITENESNNHNQDDTSILSTSNSL